MKNNSRIKMTAIASCTVLSSVFLLTACSNSSATPSAAPSVTNSSAQASQTASSAKIKIAAAENFYGEVAKAVGGDRVDVTSILDNPSVDPHDYEPTPDVAKTVSDSQVIVSNGVGYDAWMDKLVEAGAKGNSKYVIKVADDLVGKKEGDNEHVWYDPTTMPKLANQIAGDLAKIDPSQDQIFHKNAQAYISSLEPLNAKVQKIKQASATNIDVSEPVFGYMASALNLKVNDPNFAKAIDEGNDPAPADVAKLQTDIKNKAIKLFVYNSQNSSPTVDNVVKLAQSAGVPVVEVTETEPKGKNYLQWMSDQLDGVGKALGIQ